MQGLVIKSTGNNYAVRFPDGSTQLCNVKGNLRIRGIRSTNPVAVGDYVTVEDGWISDIADRRNYIIRRSTNLSKQSHILAANLDQVILMVTIEQPVTSTTFIDRFLATAEAYRVPAILLFNKIDLLSTEGHEQLHALQTLYQSIGYRTLALSANMLHEQDADMATLHTLLHDRVTLVAGNSGVGKSTLLNALFGCEITRTAEISDAHQTGMHTTTFSQMYELPFGGWIIDTPGIKGFGSLDMDKHEVGHYFREIFAASRDCRYGNCLHTGEPGCAVWEQVGLSIASSRFDSYLSMLGDETETKYR